MVRSDARDQVLSGESLYTIVTNWAANANPLALGGALAFGGAISVTLLVISREAWPFAAMLVTIGAISAWGLLEQFAPNPQARVVAAAQWILVGVGSIAAAAAALGVLFWVLGPAPIL